MARTNVRRAVVPRRAPVIERSVRTHEGAPAVIPDAEAQLERKVASLMLFEQTFYESANSITKDIEALSKQVSLDYLHRLAVKARNEFKIRHAPLWLLVQMTKSRDLAQRGVIKHAVASVIQRPDEMGELLALYWKSASRRPNGKRAPIPNQFKKGLALAFPKFDEYQLAKWNREREVTLKDVLFLAHPKPRDTEQAALWGRLIEDKLRVPDTWETRLSSGQGKKQAFTTLLQEGRLPYMALLMNLRNMEQAGVDRDLVRQALEKGAVRSRALPFRFLAAYKHAPSFGAALDSAMDAVVRSLPKLGGRTIIVVDVSGSMQDKLSSKGETERWEGAAALAILLRGVSDDARVFTFQSDCREQPNVKGLALMEAIRRHVGGGTNLGPALNVIRRKVPKADRIVVITDEQAHFDLTPCWATRGYLVNVASYTPALDTSKGWTRINGFSERLVDWIAYEERGTVQPMEDPALQED